MKKKLVLTGVFVLLYAMALATQNNAAFQSVDDKVKEALEDLVGIRNEQIEVTIGTVTSVDKKEFPKLSENLLRKIKYFADKIPDYDVVASPKDKTVKGKISGTYQQQPDNSFEVILRLDIESRSPNPQKFIISEEESKGLGVPEISASVKLPGKEFALIEGGSFLMGSPSSEAERKDDETRHRVTVNSFWMGKHEVTQAEYEKTMKKNPSRFTNE